MRINEYDMEKHKFKEIEFISDKFEDLKERKTINHCAICDSLTHTAFCGYCNDKVLPLINQVISKYYCEVMYPEIIELMEKDLQKIMDDSFNFKVRAIVDTDGVNEIHFRFQRIY